VLTATELAIATHSDRKSKRTWNSQTQEIV
jgi:hypothetical protein